MSNPLELSKQVESVVCKNSQRKFYRFRPSGCNLGCAFCWSWKGVSKPEETGVFCTPKIAADKLTSIAKENSFSQVRLTGNEPTIGWSHLIRTLENLRSSGLIVNLETNGVLIGSDQKYARDLSSFSDFLKVRVSIKGASQKEFSLLTGVEPVFFEYQIEALKNLSSQKVQCHPSVITVLSREESLQNLRNRLETINQSFFDYEEEELKLPGKAKERLQKIGIVFKKP